jgi:ferredoxin, 2Fe-2S
MPRITVTGRDGDIREINASARQTLMEVLRDANFEIEALCGGCCSCATCHVYIESAFADRLPPIGDDENFLLDCSGHRMPGASRLACQIRASEEMEGMRLTIAPAE